jgi:hypothetical protein
VKFYRGSLYDGVVLEGARFDGFSHVDDCVPQRLVTATGPNAQRSARPQQHPRSQNCTNLNKKYPHGLGKVGARDHTSGTPVTNFKRSTKLYRRAMSYDRGRPRPRQGRHRLRECLTGRSAVVAG